MTEECNDQSSRQPGKCIQKRRLHLLSVLVRTFCFFVYTDTCSNRMLYAMLHTLAKYLQVKNAFHTRIEAADSVTFYADGT